MTRLHSTCYGTVYITYYALFTTDNGPRLSTIVTCMTFMYHADVYVVVIPDKKHDIILMILRHFVPMNCPFFQISVELFIYFTNASYDNTVLILL